MWLRASVRDDKYFDMGSWNYKDKHLDFVVKESPIVHSEHVNGAEDLRVHWEDHKSAFNTSWLRAQDTSISSGLPLAYERTTWGSELEIPVCDYSRREADFETWMMDLRKFGLLKVEGCPPNTKAAEDFMHMIGPLLRRRHPTDWWFLESASARSVALEPYSYGRAALGVHTDIAYRPSPARLANFLMTHYSAPVEDTINTFVDGFKVANDLRREDPEAFHLLSSTNIRFARRRLGTLDPCDPADVHRYELDTYVDTPIIVMNGEQIERVQFRFFKHGGIPMGYDNQHLVKFYRAYKTFLSMTEDPKNECRTVLKTGSLFLIDNWRAGHGRTDVHSSTSRSLTGCYVSNETWNSRWRLLTGKLSGLEDQWLYGCSDEALEILSQRKL